MLSNYLLDSQLRGLGVADFAHEDHVGSLTKCSAQRFAEVQLVRADLTLRDERRQSRGIKIFNGILEGEQVFLAALGPLQDHRSDGG